jgi:hypothetical protein
MMQSGTVIVDILLAYNAETGCRDMHDEVSGCDAIVVEVGTTHALVELRDGNQYHVSRGRLVMARPS